MQEHAGHQGREGGQCGGFRGQGRSPEDQGRDRAVVVHKNLACVSWQGDLVEKHQHAGRDERDGQNGRDCGGIIVVERNQGEAPRKKLKGKR